MRHKSGSPPRAYPNRVLRATRIPTAAALGNLRYRYVVPILPVVACLNSRADSANCNQFAQRKQSPNGLDLRATASEQQQQQTKTGEPYPRSMPAGRRSRISCSTQDASYSLKFLAGGATRRGATMVPCEMEQKVGAGVLGCPVLFDSWFVQGVGSRACFGAERDMRVSVPKGTLRTTIGAPIASRYSKAALRLPPVSRCVRLLCVPPPPSSLRLNNQPFFSGNIRPDGMTVCCSAVMRACAFMAPVSLFVRVITRNISDAGSSRPWREKRNTSGCRR